MTGCGPSTRVMRPGASIRYGPAPSVSSTASTTSTRPASQRSSPIAASTGTAASPSGRVTPANRSPPSVKESAQRRLASADPAGARGEATTLIEDSGGGALTPRG